MKYFIMILLTATKAYATDISIYDSVAYKDKVVIEVCDDNVCDSLLVERRLMDSKQVETWTLMVHRKHTQGAKSPIEN